MQHLAVSGRVVTRADNIIPFPSHPDQPRSSVPPFDPTNPVHVAAWEALCTFGRRELGKIDGEA